jgi:hypothetical protein
MPTGELGAISSFHVGPGFVLAQDTQGLLVWREGGAQRLLEGAARWAAFPDGSVALAWGERGRVWRWWADAQAPLVYEDVGAAVVALAAGEDGRIAAGTRDERAWFGDSLGRWVHTLQLEQVPQGTQDLWAPETRGVGLLQDGSAIAISGTGEVHVLDRTWRPAAHFPLETLAYEDAVEVRALRGGRWLVASGRLLRVLSREGQGLGQWDGLRALSSDLRSLLGGAQISRLDERGELAWTCPVPPGARCMAGDEGELWVGCSDGSLLELEPHSGEVLAAYTLSDRALVRLERAHGLLCALDAGGTLKIHAQHRPLPAALPWTELRPARRLELGESTWSASWSSESRLLVRGQALSMHEALDGAELARWSLGEAMEIWSAHGSVLAYFRRHLAVYDAQTLALRGGGPVPPDNLSLVRVLPGGTLLSSVAGMIYVSADGELRQLDAGARIRQGLLHHWLSGVEVSADGARAALSPADRAGLLLSLPDGAWLAELPLKNASWSFSPDGTTLLDTRSGALFGMDGARTGQCGAGEGHSAWAPTGAGIARCEPHEAGWHAPSGERLRELPGAEGGHPRFSPAGGHLVVLAGRTLCGFDGRTGAPRGRLVLPGEGSLRAQFLTEDRLLVWANTTEPQDPTAWLLTGAGELLAVLSLPCDEALHRDSPVVYGDWLVLATPSGHPWRFALADGARAGVLAGHRGGLRSIEPSPSGRSLLTVDHTGLALVW